MARSKIYEALMPFLGSKAKLLDSISPHFRGHVLGDIFMGSGAVSLRGKAMGMRVIGNDIAKRSKIFGEAVIKNQNVRISEEDVASLFLPTENSGFIEKNFVPRVFLPEMAEVLDNAFAQARKRESPKRELLEYLLVKYILGSRQFGAFQVGVQDNKMILEGKVIELIEEASSDARAGKIAGSLQPAYKKLMAVREKINRAVFNNGEENEIYQMDCFDFLKLMKKRERKIDTIYFDSPYAFSTNYSTHYKVLDQILEEKMDVELKDEAFNRKDALANFEKLFAMSEWIPRWIISMGHNVDSDKGIKGEELLSVVQKFKPAKLIFLEHNWTINNIASKSGKRQSENVEYLIVTE
ncbi:MAG: DNA adenine methylase [Leadbetterella sp.]|nr:DNA adenine methylase [Leadbetterella sp.]